MDSFSIKDMKFYFLVFLFIFSNCVSFDESSNRNSGQQIKLEKIKLKNSLIKRKVILKKSTQNKNTKDNPKRSLRKRLLAKNNFLPKSYYQAKKSKKALEMEFEKHLEGLKKTCEITKNRKDFFQKQLKSFQIFLNISLTDPNMDYSLQLLFSDIASIIEDENYSNSIDKDTFNLLYRRLYNFPEKAEVTDYTDKWAIVIAQSIECAQKEMKKN